MPIALVTHGHPLRAQTEEFIAEVYRESYAVRLESFAPTLVAMVDGANVRCAAGLRFADDGFFSQCYLDQPIHALLSRLSGRQVNADRIFEVSSLSSRSPADAPRFLRHIVAFGESAGFDWSIFTATERLRRLLVRIGLPMSLLAVAEATRVDCPETWGTYYQARPALLAVDRTKLTASHSLHGEAHDARIS